MNMMQFLEYSPLKLLLNSDKCNKIIEVADEKRSYDDSFPISIELQLIDACNLNCQWCIEKKSRKNVFRLKYSLLLELVEELVNSNVGITIEGGGEPTIYEKFEQFVLHVHTRKLALGLITNGVKMFSTSLVDKFKWIRISLDSSNPEEFKACKGKDCFSQVLKNIENMCLHKGDTLIGVSYVLCKMNHGNILKLLEKLEKIGVDYVYFRPVETHDELLMSKEKTVEFNERLNRFLSSSNLSCILLNSRNNTKKDNKALPCVAHSLTCIIRANGDVMLCEKREHDPICLGNISRSSFFDIWNSPKRIEVTKRLLNPEQQAGCEICRITRFNELFYNLGNLKSKEFI